MTHETFYHALESASHCDDRGYTLVDEAGRECTLSHQRLVAAADACAALLAELGTRRGDRVGICTTNPRDFLISFFGAIRAGAVGVPLPPPVPTVDLAHYGESIRRTLAIADCRVLLVDPKLRELISMVSGGAGVESATAVADASLARPDGRPRAASPTDLALLQFTSGSTSAPKGVRVSHRCLMANARALLGEGLRVDPKVDVGVSWLPLYHDMGLIGFGIGVAVCTARAVLIPPLRFLRHPATWLDAVEAHRGTISFAPNFALWILARRAAHARMHWDLSSLRVLGCGSEPIQPAVLRAFEERVGRPCGLPPNAILPCYGLAEATLAVSFGSLHDRYRTDWIDTEALARDGVALSVEPGEGAAEVVSCGRGFAGHQIRIAGPDGVPLPPRRQGEIHVRGPSLADGYQDSPAATADTFHDGWLRTGDLGFIDQEGDLFVTGRVKQLLILHGRNYHPCDVERTVEDVIGVRAGSIVAFSRPGSSSEELVVAAEVRTSSARIAGEIRSGVRRTLGLNTADVVLLPRGAIPKTSSGKLRRNECRARYLRGEWSARQVDVDPDSL